MVNLVTVFSREREGNGVFFLHDYFFSKFGSSIINNNIDKKQKKQILKGVFEKKGRFFLCVCFLQNVYCCCWHIMTLSYLGDRKRKSSIHNYESNVSSLKCHQKAGLHLEKPNQNKKQTNKNLGGKYHIHSQCGVCVSGVCSWYR